MQLDIILRTHDQGSVHGRDVPYAKKEIVQRCVNSLYTAVDGVEGVNLVTVDDHSSDETVSMLRNLIPLQDSGNNASLIKVFELAAESTADLVYIVEDDYLHYPEAISEMLETWQKFIPQVQGDDMCLSLVDCPANYHRDGYFNGGIGRDGSTGMIVGGINRAWRSNTHTGGTFCTTPTVINKYWGAFDDLCKNWPNVDENKTWNKVWEQHVPLFTPLIPLAYHLSEIHPYHPHDKLWRANKSMHTLKKAA
jgi:glycosyltransferase involved in cell wall biosynthesis